MSNDKTANLAEGATPATGHPAQMTTGGRVQVLRMRLVTEVTGLSRTGIYERMARNDFPRPIPLAAKTVGWLSNEVDAWIAARAAGPRAGGGA
jgi:prophage regulatory protein